MSLTMPVDGGQRSELRAMPLRWGGRTGAVLRRRFLAPSVAVIHRRSAFVGGLGAHCSSLVSGALITTQGVLASGLP